MLGALFFMIKIDKSYFHMTILDIISVVGVRNSEELKSGKAYRSAKK